MFHNNSVLVYRYQPQGAGGRPKTMRQTDLGLHKAQFLEGITAVGWSWAARTDESLHFGLERGLYL